MSAKNMRRADLVFEIGCEELPAGMIAKAAAEFKAILEKYLSTENLLEKSSIEVFGGPRRLTAICEDLRAQQPDDVREVTGPPKSVAYDNVGQPTRAAVSFSEKQGVALTDTYIVSTNRGEFLAAKLHTKGRSAEAILAEIVATRGFRNPMASSDVLGWPGRSEIHPPDSVGRGDFRRENSKSDYRRRRSRSRIAWPPLPWKELCGDSRRCGLRICAQEKLRDRSSGRTAQEDSDGARARLRQNTGSRFTPMPGCWRW